MWKHKRKGSKNDMRRNTWKRVLMVILFTLIAGTTAVHAAETSPGGGTGSGTGTEGSTGSGTGTEGGTGSGTGTEGGTGETNPTTPSDPGTEVIWRKPCGANVEATLSRDGILTVSGSGPMYDFSENGSIFNEIKNEIYQIVVKEGVTVIGQYAFKNTKCARLEIGPSVTWIKRQAFMGSYNLNSVTIPPNVNHIGWGVFRECSNLISCKLSKGLQLIDKYAFYGTALTSIEIPEGVTAIGKCAFLGTKLTEVEIPDSVRTIEEQAFGKVNAKICGMSTAFGKSAFAAGSVLSVLADSSAETYAKANGLTVTYFGCMDENGAPVPHSWDEGTITKESTCKDPGVKTYKCTKCSATKTENLALLPHSYGAWTQKTAATVFAAGSEERVCSACNGKETRTISKVTPVIVMNTSSITLEPGATYKLRVVTKGAGDSVSSWQSMNKKVATVTHAGKVKAKAPGSAKIKVTLKSGISATVKVKVSKVATQELTVKAKGATLKNKKISVKLRKSFRLVAKVKPANSTNKVTFVSSKKSVATVDKNGKVTTRKRGKTRITVKSGKIAVKITLTVK